MAYNSLTLLPAYSRDYKSKSALIADWGLNMDFIAYGLPTQITQGYVNKQQTDQLKTAGYTHLHFRYNKQTLVHVVKL